MDDPSPKIVGSVVLGFALVAGSYVLANFGESPSRPIMANNVANAATAIPRQAIAVTDANNNGVEDWRDEFVAPNPVRINNTQASAEYTPPETLTGEVGIDLLRGKILSSSRGPFASTPDEIVTNAIRKIDASGRDQLYDVADIIIVPTTDENIRAYANGMAQAFIDADIGVETTSIELLTSALEDDDTEAIATLQNMAGMYQTLRDRALNNPVPEIAAKEHLDAINAYNAAHKNMAAMTEIDSDPLRTLTRIQRYQDDITGLWFALQNLYVRFEPYATLFTPDDPAVLFVAFSPRVQ